MNTLPHKPPALNPTPLHRRTTLKAISAWACGASGLLQSPGMALAQAPTSDTTEATPLSPNAQAWRVMARLGYGPTAALVRAVNAAASPRAWALQQVDAAYTASQQPPRIAADLASFNAPLPQLFEGVRREREARAQLKAQDGGKKGGKADPNTENKAEDDSPALRRYEFTGTPAPEHFSRTMAQQAAAWRLTSCSQPDDENPLLARMTEFWFNHLNVYVGKGAVRPFTGHYVVNVARAHALGQFEDLLLASARHPAMLHYLDQVQSVADGSRGPQGKTRGLNENYARELMELHTLGVNGGYTQTDVRELARVLTGWTIGPTDRSGFRFAPRMHDTSSKQVLGKPFPSGFGNRGEAEGEQAIRMLARHPATAQRISLRLAQFFVADQPAPELVQRLARTFQSTQGDLRSVMRTLLESPDFWQAKNRLFKTPMDYACSALAATHASTEAQRDRRHMVLSAGFLANAGQALHGWQTPDGYKVDAATWLVPEALTRRADYALALTKQSQKESQNLDFLLPYLSTATRDAIAKEPPAFRAGLVLASPDFMYK